jgi:hypothetical protein
MKGGNKKEEDCPICLQKLGVFGNLIGNLDIYTTTCGHPFHTGCLYECLTRNNNCPLCRTEIDSDWDNIQQIYDKQKFESEQRLSESELDEVLEESGFMELEGYGDDIHCIRYWKANLRKFRYDKNGGNCFSGEVENKIKNLKEQAIAKLKVWIENGEWE